MTEENRVLIQKTDNHRGMIVVAFDRNYEKYISVSADWNLFYRQTRIKISLMTSSAYAKQFVVRKRFPELLKDMILKVEEERKKGK